jgi:hypothetical protein
MMNHVGVLQAVATMTIHIASALLANPNLRKLCLSILVSLGRSPWTNQGHGDHSTCPRRCRRKLGVCCDGLENLPTLSSFEDHIAIKPGALGSGLIELESTQALVALVRRWNVECCGQESGFLCLMENVNNHNCNNNNNNNNNNSCNNMTRTKLPPKKRGR